MFVFIRYIIHIWISHRWTPGFEEHKGEAETLAGFILEINEKFPQLNEQIMFEDYKFKIEVLDKKRIKQIKVTKPTIQDVTPT